MGLKKDIEDSNGIMVSYHRVVRLQSIINHSSLIEIASYVSQQKRNMEKGNPSFSNVYSVGTYYSIPYDPELNVVKAYEYIKSLPEFEGAEDILDEDISGLEENNDDATTGDATTEV